jgi:hypothetical protein
MAELHHPFVPAGIRQIAKKEKGQPLERHMAAGTGLPVLFAKRIQNKTLSLRVETQKFREKRLFARNHNGSKAVRHIDWLEN